MLSKHNRSCAKQHVGPFSTPIGPSRRQFVSTVVRAPNHARLYPGEHPSPHGWVKWAPPSPLGCFSCNPQNLESRISVDSCQSEQDRTALRSLEPNWSYRTEKEEVSAQIRSDPYFNKSHIVAHIKSSRRAHGPTECHRNRQRAAAGP